MGIYAREWQIFKKDYLSSFLWVLGISLGLTLFLFVVLIQNPDIARMYWEEIRQKISEQVEFFGGNLEQLKPERIFLVILMNNLSVSLLILILGLVPIVILPPYPIISTFLSVGVLLAYFHIVGGNALDALIKGILPHGMIELTGMLFTSSLGIYLSKSIAKKLFSKHRHEIELKLVFIQTARSFILVSVPLIVLAAAIEGFITPLFLKY
jgi:stage II sporulation protein M